MNELELLRSWIGRTNSATDVLTPGLVERLRATLGEFAPSDPDAVPPCAHWCLAPFAVSGSQLGEDGHPAKGDFLPPVSLPRRMWAGGELTFGLPLRIGDVVTRESRIADVTEKSGRSGHLVFVSVEHEVSTERGLAISERQDLVYKAMPTEKTGETTTNSTPARQADWSRTVQASPVMLFRYSALTFNSHRIHYDRDYAISVEHYPDLVVQGPLQATLLAGLAANRLGRLPARLRYRGARPLFCGRPLSVNAADCSGEMVLWTADPDGNIGMDSVAVA